MSNPQERFVLRANVQRYLYSIYQSHLSLLVTQVHHLHSRSQLKLPAIDVYLSCSNAEARVDSRLLLAVSALAGFLHHTPQQEGSQLPGGMC